MKKHCLFLILSLLLAAVLLSGCGGDSDKEKPALRTVEDLQSYTIVRGDDADGDTVSAAVTLRGAFRDTIGTDVKLTTDWVGRGEEVPVGTKEILVGATNRPESSESSLLYMDYEIAGRGDRIVITGGCGAAVCDAVDWFLANCVDPENGTVGVPAEPYVFHASYALENVTVDGIPLWEYSVCAGEGTLTDLTEAKTVANWLIAQTGHPVSVNDKNAKGLLSISQGENMDMTACRVTSGNGRISVELNVNSNFGALGIDNLGAIFSERTTDALLALNVSVGVDDAYRRTDAAMIAEWRAMTDARIGEILSSASMELPETGLRYYVSNSGSDDNDGRTPETAWATLAKVSSDALTGSTVLFERGSVFRGQLTALTNVTYSAYGEGEKPKLYGSPENGADPAKWTQTADDPTVWVYETPFKEDVGTMVFNEGEAYAVKYVLKAEGDGIATETGHSGDCINMTWGNRFSDYHDLLYDLDFWHDDSDRKVYMRSRENPGVRFDSIEFNVHHNVIAVKGNGVTIDNLCVKYGGSHGVGAGTVNDLTVQNCEFGWIGGSIQYVRDNRTVRFGNAVEIYGGCNRYNVTDNYIYQVYDAGITQQYSLSDTDLAEEKIVNQKNVTYARNVIEYCNYSIEYFLGKVPDANPSHMENFLIEDNFMWYAGTGLCEQRPDLTEGSHIKGWNHSNRAVNYVIRNNYLIESKDLMVHIYSNLLNPDGSESMPELYGNIFANHDGGMFGSCAQNGTDWKAYDFNMMDYLGEKTHDDSFFFISPGTETQIGLAPAAEASTIRPENTDAWVLS